MSRNNRFDLPGSPPRPLPPPATTPPSRLAFSYAQPHAQVAAITETATAFSAQYAYTYDPTRRKNERVVTGNGSIAVPAGPASITLTANALKRPSSREAAPMIRSDREFERRSSFSSCSSA